LLISLQYTTSYITYSLLNTFFLKQSGELLHELLKQFGELLHELLKQFGELSHELLKQSCELSHELLKQSGKLLHGLLNDKKARVAVCLKVVSSKTNYPIFANSTIILPVA